jgi:hypothetical protein
MATASGAAPDTHAPAESGASRGGRRPRLPRPSVVAVLVLVAAAVAMYLRPVLELGFYYDDWLLMSAMQDAPSGSWPDVFAACRAVDPAGRFGGCVYHASAYFAFGEHAAAYHVMSIVLLAASAILLYALLRRCRLEHWPALLACVLFVVYPGSDSTRLWPTGLAAQYVLVVYLGALLLGIEGVRRATSRNGRLAWHAASLGLFLLLLFTYEVVVPLIAVTVAAYLLAAPGRRRAALARGAVDLVLALGFSFYRLVVAPVRGGSGFAEDRTIAETIDRLGAVLDGAWASFQPLFLPGVAAAVVVAGGALVCATAMGESRDVRRASVRWLLVAAAAALLAVISVLPFVPANVYYVPDSDSLFNRLNLTPAPAYCVFFVALAGLLWTALSHWLPRAVATAAVGVLVLLVAAGQVGHERRSQDAWATSWDAQRAALGHAREASPRLTGNVSVMSFGHPLWERGYIPVFTSKWDLRGAIDAETPADPSRALPFVDGARCGPRAVVVDKQPYLAYQAASRLWFVNLATGEARRISSSARCEAAIAAWGRPPFWGKTITG